jgi:hypothetical protein
MISSTKGMHQAFLEYKDEIQKMEQLRQNKILAEEAKIYECVNEVQNILENKKINQRAYMKFSEDVKKSLLSEALLKLYDKSVGFQLEYFNNEPFKISLVNKFVEEQGVDKLINKFRGTTYLLSEMARIVTKYHKSIIESIDKDNPESYVIKPEDRDNFFDELDMDTIEDVADQIKIRVTNAVEEFIQNNVSDKLDIKDIIQNTQEKINNTTNESVKMELETMSKRKISDIRNNRIRNIFEQMVRNISESVIKDERLRELYSDNGKLNIDKVIESSRLMYTFLELCNTTKIVKVNEMYINEVLNGLKG